MPRRHLAHAALVGLAVLTLLALNPSWTPSAGAVDPDHVSVGFSQMSTGLDHPTAIATANDGTGRLFVVEQPGRIRVRISGSGLRSTPYLDIRGRVNYDGNERGMLGLAFHPSFKSNGYFFVTYTDSEGDLRVSRFHASPTSNTASSSSEKIIIQVVHRSNANHNAGQLVFGTKYLYISTGDGGGAGGPGGYAQSKDSLLGKILRLDIDRGCSHPTYCIPSTNPFIGDTPGRGEIWHYGMRNPWRFSFDRSNYNMWIADVGQSDEEEIDRISSGVSGRNLGWDCYEGNLNTVASYGGSYCSGKTFTKPVHVYGHSSGRCAIVGGYVYRGSTYKSIMGGMYLYADYCTGEVWALYRHSDGTWDNAKVHDHSSTITSFGQGAGGELYVVSGNGAMYHLTAHSI